MPQRKPMLRAISRDLAGRTRPGSRRWGWRIGQSSAERVAAGAAGNSCYGMAARAGFMTFGVSIFDYNGVLVDDEAVHLAAFREALAPLGVSVGEEAYWQRYIGFDDREGFAAILADAGRPASDELIEALVRRKQPLYLERARRELKSFSGASELLRGRSARGPVVVVSGALKNEIHLGLEWLGVTDRVAHVVSAEDTRASKPDPEGYLLACTWLESHGWPDCRKDAVVFEDSLAGIAAAKAAGLCCVAVAHSYSAEELKATEADLVVDHIGQIDEASLEALYAQIAH